LLVNWLTPVTPIKLSIKLGQVVFGPKKRFSIIAPEDIKAVLKLTMVPEQAVAYRTE
jgi:hypothetical protein